MIPDERDGQILMLQRDLADAYRRIQEMIAEIDQRDELISDLQRRIADLEAIES